MARKRPNGEGSVHRLPSGSWCAQIYQAGKRLSKTFSTQREALAWIQNIRGQIKGGMNINDYKLSVGQYVTQWLTDTRTAKAPSTWSHQRQLVNQYILPSIGIVKLCDLNTHCIQTLYNQLFDEHVGVYTIRKLHLILHASLQTAVINGVIQRNPASNAKPPREPSSEVVVLDEGQARQFLVTAYSHRLFALFQLALSSGMRMGELLGARWGDIDFSKGTILVQRQLSRAHGAIGNSVHFSSLKTKNSRRSIPLSSHTIEVLHEQKQAQLAACYAAGEKWQDYDLIFTTKYGTPLQHRNVLRSFKTLLSISGLPDVHFHSLRHSFASILLRNHVPIHTVSKMLGHSSPATTLRLYSHIFTGMESEASNLIDNLIMPISVQLEKSIPS